MVRSARGPTTQIQQGWAREWLDQELDVRPDEEGKAAVAEIAERARRVRRVRVPARRAQLNASRLRLKTAGVVQLLGQVVMRYASWDSVEAV